MRIIRSNLVFTVHPRRCRAMLVAALACEPPREIQEPLPMGCQLDICRIHTVKEFDTQIRFLDRNSIGHEFHSIRLVQFSPSSGCR